MSLKKYKFFQENKIKTSIKLWLTRGGYLQTAVFIKLSVLRCIDGETE